MVQINENDTRLELVVPSRTKWGGVSFMGGWLLFWGLTEGACFYVLWSIVATWAAGGEDIVRAAISENRLLSGLFLVFFFFWSMNGWQTIKQLVWELWGVEKIMVEQGRLTIKREIKGWQSERVYEGSAVSEWKILSGKVTRAWQTASNYNWSTSIALIQFLYHDEEIQFGNGIKEEEAGQIMRRIQDKLGG